MTKTHKIIDILNDTNYYKERVLFRVNKIQKYAATEIAFIGRYLSGEKQFIPGRDFSFENLQLIKSLSNI